MQKILDIPPWGMVYLLRKDILYYSLMIPEIKRQIPAIKTRAPLTEKIIACTYKVHSELFALKEAKLNYVTEKQFKVNYQNKQAGNLKVDLIVEDKVIVEVKALTGDIPKVFEA